MSETTIPPNHKQCTKCKEWLPETREYFIWDASRIKKGYSPLTPQCKQCRNGGFLPDCLYCGKSLKGLRRKAYCSLPCRIMHSVGGIGARHGRLTILDYAGQKEQRDASSLVRCLCDCGEYTIVEHANIISGGTKSCGCLIKDRPKGKDHHGWKGGRRKLRQGYIVLHKPEHPNAMSDGYVLEHVYVMSEFLGRPMRKGEEIHHKNGDKAFNDIRNLQLWTKSQPTGQRVEDMLEFCKSYIKQYEADVRKLAKVHEPADPRQSTLFA